MASFYECSKCENEFLGHDHIPDGDEVFPICDRCGHSYYRSCNSRESMTIDEEEE